MATMNVSLPDPMREWVEAQVESGLYSNASDYVRDLIRRDQEYKDKHKALLNALEAGEKSGASKRTIDEIWKDVKTRTG
ncbi:MAG: type II toxin-antitoxin system ParD family antitoxin [Gammaproteobacteria bacterium]